MIPLATSLIVPSPPQAMMNLLPFPIDLFAISRPSPGPFVKATVNGPKWLRRSDAISDQRVWVEPPADFGFTITSGKPLAGLSLEELFVFPGKICDLFDRGEILQFVIGSDL